jgi:hypothetical protein
MPANMQPKQGTVPQPGGEQVGSGEDVSATGEIVNAEPIWDDPLDMQAGLVVKGVSFFHETISLVDNLPLAVAVYRSLQN